jgi:hypothetical protein
MSKGDAERLLIPGYAACFKCEEVFSYVVGGSHSQLSQHANKCLPAGFLKNKILAHWPFEK